MRLAFVPFNLIGRCGNCRTGVAMQFLCPFVFIRSLLAHPDVGRDAGWPGRVGAYPFPFAFHWQA